MSQKISEMTVIGALLPSHKVAIDEAEVPGVSQYSAEIQQILGLAVSGAFWPSTGAFDLSGNVLIDGNGNDLSFGDPNALTNFNIHADVITAYNPVTYDQDYSGSFTNNQAVSKLYVDTAITSADFWPLGGAADLTNDTTIDGNNFNLSLGSPNRINAFNLLTDNTQTFDVDDGVASSAITLTTLGLSIEHLAGGTTDLNSSWSIDGNNFDLYIGLPNPLTNFNVLTDQSIYLDSITGSDESYISVDQANGITLGSGDGVDTATLSLTPLEFNLALGVIGSDNAFLFQATNANSSISAFDALSEGYSLVFEPANCYFVDVRSTPLGIEYESDYSAGFTDRSLVDKGYVDAAAGGGVVGPYVPLSLTGDVAVDGNTNAITFFDLNLFTVNVDAISLLAATDIGIAATDNINLNTSGAGLAVSGAAVTVTAPFIVHPYTVATLPSAATHTRGLIYVTDETAGATLAFSNGTNWLRCYDGNIVS